MNKLDAPELCPRNLEFSAELSPLHRLEAHAFNRVQNVVREARECVHVGRHVLLSEVQRHEVWTDLRLSANCLDLFDFIVLDLDLAENLIER
jgi:hypothetical protein